MLAKEEEYDYDYDDEDKDWRHHSLTLSHTLSLLQKRSFLDGC